MTSETLNAVTRAFMTLETGANEQAIELLDLAANRLDATQHALNQAEHGRFSGWYDNDTKFKMKDLETRIKETRASIQAADGTTET